VLSILTGRIFRSTLLKGADAPFVMELPPYRMPMAKSLMIHMWDRSRIFLRKMTQIILLGSVIIWALLAFPRGAATVPDGTGAIAPATASSGEPRAAAGDAERHAAGEASASHAAERRRVEKAEQAEQSYIGRLGRFVEPVFAPLGIEWRGAVALLSGFVAKEIVVSTLGVLYATGDGKEEEALEAALHTSGMTALSALSMMVFVLLYLPCLATTSAIRKETGSARWMFFSIGYSTTVAWGVAFLVYQSGRLLGFSL
jgi:ferrous iron transport protein B